MGRKSDHEQRSRAYRQLSLAISIPGLMLAGVLVGLGLAWVARKFFHAPDWVEAVCVLLGTVAGFVQVFHLIQKINRP